MRKVVAVVDRGKGDTPFIIYSEPCCDKTIALIRRIQQGKHMSATATRPAQQ